MIVNIEQVYTAAACELWNRYSMSNNCSLPSISTKPRTNSALASFALQTQSSSLTFPLCHNPSMASLISLALCILAPILALALTMPFLGFGRKKIDVAGKVSCPSSTNPHPIPSAVREHHHLIILHFPMLTALLHHWRILWSRIGFGGTASLEGCECDHCC